MIYTVIILYLLGVFLTHKTVDVASSFMPDTGDEREKYIPTAIWICAIFWPLFSLSLLMKKPR